MLKVWMSHGDKVTALPPGFKLMASTPSCPIAGMADEDRKFYAVQFHPSHAYRAGQGHAVALRQRICGCQGDWNMPTTWPKPWPASASRSATTKSSWACPAAWIPRGRGLIHKAIGDKLTCVFVDHGLLRLDEGKQVMQTFAENMGVKIIHIDATARFMGKLSGVADPEAKRKIIGREFVEVFQDQAGKQKSARVAGQGTIYPDVIESAGAKTGKATRSSRTTTSAACPTR